MTIKIKIKAQDLFNALREEYKFITCDKENFGYVHAWKFKPILDKDFINTDIMSWHGSKHTNEELGYSFDLTEIEKEMPFYLSGNGAVQNLWEVEEFIGKTTTECILERGVNNV